MYFRYIRKKDGSVMGPYAYKTVRVGGKTRTIYLGAIKPGVLNSPNKETRHRSFTRVFTSLKSLEQKERATREINNSPLPKSYSTTTEDAANAETTPKDKKPSTKEVAKPDEETPKAIKKKKAKEKKEKPIEKIKFSGKKELSKDEKPLMKKRFNEQSESATRESTDTLLAKSYSTKTEDSRLSREIATKEKELEKLLNEYGRSDQETTRHQAREKATELMRLKEKRDEAVKKKLQKDSEKRRKIIRKQNDELHRLQQEKARAYAMISRDLDKKIKEEEKEDLQKTVETELKDINV